MELMLTRQSPTQANVACDGQMSHKIDLPAIIPDPTLREPPSVKAINPESYGQALFQALFPASSVARAAFETDQGRIVLTALDPLIDAIPWEYLYGPKGFVVLDRTFVRGIDPARRVATPALEQPLHIITVPTAPLDPTYPPLAIDDEWTDLGTIIQRMPARVTLERARPPTLEQVRRMVARQRERVVHFMGHGERTADGVFLCFEQADGSVEHIDALSLARALRGTTYLITFNACHSAEPRSVVLSSVAAQITHHGIPYALGMRDEIPDKHALTFSRVLYNELVEGTPVEEAVHQARGALARSRDHRLVGLPVLYTALEHPGPAFHLHEGAPAIHAHQTPLDVRALPRAPGGFYGRERELQELGSLLTSDRRPPIITIHGSGGQGKTALAREAVERFAWAWPGGVIAVSLDTLPSRADVVHQIATFLGLSSHENLAEQTGVAEQLEHQVLAHLEERRLLLVLDNAETLVEQASRRDPTALELSDFLRSALPRQRVTLLVTSRHFLGWTGEEVLELDGLEPRAGRLLFSASAIRRRTSNDLPAAIGPEVEHLSQLIGGHPLSLRLLGGAFNSSDLSLTDFIARHYDLLASTEDIYLPDDHRHHSLQNSIAISVEYLDERQRMLLSKLHIFNAPFTPMMAAGVCTELPVDETLLVELTSRALIVTRQLQALDGGVVLYQVVPAVRLYIERYLAEASDQDLLGQRLALVQADFIEALYERIRHGNRELTIARAAYEDFERGLNYIPEEQRALFMLHWGRISAYLGRTGQAIELLEGAIEAFEGDDEELHARARHHLANLLQAKGEHRRALELYELVLPWLRTIEHTQGLAATLHNIAALHIQLGQTERTLALFEESLTLQRLSGDDHGVATTCFSMATVYKLQGDSGRAFELLTEALGIFTALGDHHAMIGALMEITNLLQYKGQSRRAIPLLEQLLPAVERSGDVAALASLWNSLGVAHAIIGERERALVLYERALKLREVIDDQYGQLVQLSNMLEAYTVLGRVREALECGEAALKLQKQIDNHDKEAAICQNLAAVYVQQGSFSLAAEAYERALASARRLRNLQAEAAAQRGLGDLYHQQGRPQVAMALLEQSLAKSERIEDLDGQAATLSQMARVMRDTGKIERAMTLFQRTLGICQATGNLEGEGSTLNNMALIYSRTGNPQQALKLYEQSLTVARKMPSKPGEASVLGNMGEIHRGLRQAERALQYFRRASELHKEFKDSYQESTLRFNMGLAYKDLERYEEALTEFQRSLELSSEVNDRAGEIAAHHALSVVLVVGFRRTAEALAVVDRALAIFDETGLSQDASGTTPQELRSWRAQLRLQKG